MQVHDGVGILHELYLSNHGGYSFRSRPFGVITGALGDLGCSVSEGDGDFMVSGPAVPGNVALDLSKGSQPLSHSIAAPSLGVDMGSRFGRGRQPEIWYDCGMSVVDLK